MFLPFLVKFPAKPKQGRSLPFMGCRWRRGAVEDQKYKYSHPSGCSGGILIPVWKGPSAARAMIAVTGRTRWAQAGLGHGLGKDELFWALQLQGCAEPLQWRARSCLGVDTMHLPSRAPRSVFSHSLCQANIWHWAGGLEPKVSLPWKPKAQRKPQRSWLVPW